jgi:Zn-dependent peptidase ImmA (M78 family)
VTAAAATKPPSGGSLTRTEALAIIREHQDSAPVKVSAIARDMGLLIFSASLDPGISGKLFMDERAGASSGWVIYVNRDEPEVRQRFTAAHEIAHFVLHRHLIGEALADDEFYRSKLSSPLEAEANSMAADILMPWNLINEITQSGVKDLAALAERLEVSETALAIRLGLPT